MAIVINGSGTVTGLAVGGLPDGTVDDGTVASGIASSKLTGALPAISGAALTNTGKVLQVVSVEYIAVTAITSTSYVDSGSEITITPSSTSSKMLVTFDTAYQAYLANANCFPYARIIRGSTTVYDFGIFGRNHVNTIGNWGAFHMSFLDSPASTAAQTYKVQYKVGAGTLTVNSAESDAIMTVMEIGA